MQNVQEQFVLKLNNLKKDDPVTFFVKQYIEDIK